MSDEKKDNDIEQEAQEKRLEEIKHNGTSKAKPVITFVDLSEMQKQANGMRKDSLKTVLASDALIKYIKEQKERLYKENKLDSIDRAAYEAELKGKQ